MRIKKIIKTMCFITLMFLFSKSIMYGENQSVSMTLKQCLNEGLKKNINILNSEYDKKKADLKINEARSSGLPQIEASIQTLDYLKKSVMLLPGELMGNPGSNISLEIGTKYVTSATIKFNQLLYSQTYFLALDVTKKYSMLGEISLEKTKNEFIFDLTKIYILASITNQQTTLIDKNILRLDTIINNTKTALDNGYVNKVDLDRAEVNKSELKVQLEITKNLYQQQLDLIKYFIDYPKNITITESTETLLKNSEIIFDSTDVLNRKEIVLLNLQSELYNDNVTAIKYEYLPTLSLIGSFQYQNMREDYKLFGEKWYGNSYIGLNLSIPVFDGLNKSSRIEQAEVEHNKLEANLNDTKKYFFNDFAQSKRDYQQCISTSLVRNQNVILAENILTVSRTKYSEGALSMTDLLADEIALCNSELNFLNAKMQLLFSELSLLKSTGKLEILLNN
jgi:outer membrane protein